AETLEIIRRRISMRVHRKQLALNQIRLGWLSQANGNVGLAHREVELFVGRDQRDADIRIKVEKFAEPRRQPMYADTGRGGDLEFAVRALAAVGELGARRLELHEHFVRSAIQHIALLGQDQSARMAME